MRGDGGMEEVRMKEERRQVRGRDPCNEAWQLFQRTQPNCGLCTAVHTEGTHTSILSIVSHNSTQLVDSIQTHPWKLKRGDDLLHRTDSTSPLCPSAMWEHTSGPPAFLVRLSLRLKCPLYWNSTPVFSDCTRLDVRRAKDVWLKPTLGATGRRGFSH